MTSDDILLLQIYLTSFDSALIRLQTHIDEAYDSMQHIRTYSDNSEIIAFEFEDVFGKALEIMMGYLEMQGDFTVRNSKVHIIISRAFDAKLISNKNVWLHARDMRNEIAHKFDIIFAQIFLTRIKRDYFAIFEEFSRTIEQLIQTELTKGGQDDEPA